MKNIENSLIAASYSYKQKVYHVETLKEFIDNSYDAAFVRDKTDFYMIGIFNTYDQANQFVESTKNLLSDGSVFAIEGKKGGGLSMDIGKNKNGLESI